MLALVYTLIALLPFAAIQRYERRRARRRGLDRAPIPWTFFMWEE